MKTKLLMQVLLHWTNVISDWFDFEMISYYSDLVMEVQYSWAILLNWPFLVLTLEILMVWKKFDFELAMEEVEMQQEMPLALN